MQNDRSKNSNLIGRTVLLAPSTPRELVVELERYGARIITWPEIEIVAPESFTALDEAIENLFGYDWLIFRTGNAAKFFLKRFQKLGHDVSELDTLRVCAIGGATVEKLEASQVHIDVIPRSNGPDMIVEAIGNYVGGRAVLGRLNFLVPRASAAQDGLCDLLEDAEARVDVVMAYRTVSDKAALAQQTALLNGGGIDVIVFDSPFSVRKLAELFDVLELGPILAGIAVFCLDESTMKEANDCGVPALLGSVATDAQMAEAIANHFQR